MSDHERYEQLLADEATHDLTAETRKELDYLIRLHPDWHDDTFELAAAALLLAMSQPVDAMPEHLRQRLEGA